MYDIFLEMKYLYERYAIHLDHGLFEEQGKVNSKMREMKDRTADK